MEERKIRLKRATKAQQNKLSTGKLEVLITIVNRAKTDFFTDLIASFGVNMQFSMAANGTADTELLTRLGIATSDKTVIFSVIKQEDCANALATLDDKFRTIKNGNGIAYTIPMSSIIGVSAFAFLSDKRQGGIFDAK